MGRVRWGPKRHYNGQLALEPQPRCTIALILCAAATVLARAFGSRAHRVAVILVACSATVPFSAQHERLSALVNGEEVPAKQ